MKTNDWQKRFGAIRRAKDKAYAQALEQLIAAEEKAAVWNPDAAPTHQVDEDLRQRIAQAYEEAAERERERDQFLLLQTAEGDGAMRKIEEDMRREIARAFGRPY